ncbi:hypothetical protein ABEB36_004394 [Hypothenemus hampei]|uniref:Cytochrome P450 n=1 Tax=Hypothenemus hampei TaxID=57062 RepID=A0ABD1F3T2_HYPHA
MGLDMLWFLIKILCYTGLIILVYNIYIPLRYFQIYKFHLKQSGLHYPLLPFVGQAYAALLSRATKVNMLGSFLWIERHFGTPISTWFGNKLYYVSNNAEEARIILNHPKSLDKAEQYQYLKHLFRNSILVLPGEEWKKRRRYLRAAFKSNILNSFMTIFNQQAHVLNEKITNLQPNQDLYKFFNIYSFMNFFLTSVGWIEGISEEELEEFGSYIDSCQDEFVKLLLNPVIPAAIWMRIPPGKKLRATRREFKSLLKKLLLKKKLSMTSSEYKGNTNDVVLLDLILDNNYHSENRDNDTFEEFSLFAAAATDTTGHTYVFCFMLLGMHPDVQNKLYEEVTTVIGDTKEISELQVNQLIYTEAFIKETLRVLPAIPLYGRYISEDIDMGTKVIPKGANFIVSAFHIHRNPEHWKDPLKFDPSRFFPENASKIVPGSFVAFSGGPRNCIGEKVAMIQLKITIAHVIRQFRIESKHKSLDEFEYFSTISMKTINKIDLNMLGSFLWIERHFGTPISTWFGNKLYYVSNNAEEARIILNHPKSLDKAEQYQYLKHLFRNSILVLPGEEWKKRRRYLRAAFKSNVLKTFMPVFNEQAYILNDKITNLHPNEDLFKFFNDYSFRSFFLTSVGWIEGINEEEVEKFGSYTDSFQDEFVKLLLNPVIPSSIWVRIPPGKKLRTTRREFKNLLTQILLKKKLSMTTSEYKGDTNDVVLLDLILDNNHHSENRDNDTFEEFSLFAAAATDTTGHTYVFCFMLLGMHPDVQNKLYEEVTTVIGDTKEISELQVNQLIYTEAFIKETLRVLPAVPLYGRYISEDIDMGTKVIPKGANFIVSAFHIHRNPEYWKDPLKFDPSRFFPENASKIVPGSFVAFSGGPRNCIGEKVAMIQLKITIAHVIRQFRIESKHKSLDEFEYFSTISMKTINKIDCRFIPR